MNRVICVNGHFYDGDKYQQCPHCADGVAPIAPPHFDVVHNSTAKQAEKKEKKDKKGLFSKKESKKEITPIPVEDERTERFFGCTNAEVNQQPNNESISQAKNDPKPLNDEDSNLDKDIYADPLEQKYVSQKQEESLGSMNAVALQAEFNKVTEPVQKHQSTSKVDMDNIKTVGYYSTGKASEPPVGYLICTKGNDFGIGFLLKSGNNTIGRSQDMDVAILDPYVSREKQAFVMYEPHKREFYVKPGEGAGLCYFNGDVVLGPMKIKAYDKIGVGKTELMLIPVCSEEFSWDELKEN